MSNWTVRVGTNHLVKNKITICLYPFILGLLSTVPFRLGDVGTAMESHTALVKICSFKSYTNDL